MVRSDWRSSGNRRINTAVRTGAGSRPLRRNCGLFRGLLGSPHALAQGVRGAKQAAE